LTYILKGITLALVVICVLQAYSAFTEGDPLSGLEDHLGSMAALRAATDPSPPPAPSASPTSAQPPAASAQPPAAGPAPPVPDRYTTIESSGILGALPQGPPPPALLGLAGTYAIIRTPEGQTDLVAEGGTLGTVKVVRIGINRVLIEHKGKTEELSIFDGLGGQPLVPGKEASTR
jgi:hypothetical protein